jgi:isopenicillin-N N-acyltransferase like protein
MKQLGKDNTMRKTYYLITVALLYCFIYTASAAEVELLKRCGQGDLLRADSHLVARLCGTSYEMGYQHGVLLKDKVNILIDAVLYGKVGELTIPLPADYRENLDKAWVRSSPFIPKRYKEEMRGLAAGCGRTLYEVQRANIMPELFHCSGAACFGDATVDGELYHARVLDYMTGIGLQNCAVALIYCYPDGSWVVNVGYAGFLGSVTGMNSRGVSIGEMGGGGVGDWDGMPMSFLIRHALEGASDLKSAKRIFKETPRTCEYFYVIADGDNRSACGVVATSKEIEFVAPAQKHPRLPDPVKNAVLLSAGDRYKMLVKRTRAAYGKIDAAMMMNIIKRPVAMKDNLHNVIFRPRDGVLWASHASGLLPACNQPYSRLSIPDLLAFKSKNRQPSPPNK